ncbi:MAG: phospholipid carrier-dependent glycosyltransferase, partial [Actinomycetota bacterium]
ERRRAFLNGDPYTGGRAIFYPAVIAMKTPLGTLAIWAIGLGVIVFARRRWDAVRALLPVPLTILGLAVLSSTNIGIRHIAVVPMFGAVAAGSTLLVRRGLVVAAVLVAFVAVSVWRAFPADLSYVNEAFGGPSDAYRRLADSNADWGQDLFRLADYVRAHPDRTPDWILYFGTAVPGAYGIDARDATKARVEDVHGLVAVSTSWIDLFPDRYGWVTQRGTPGELVGTTIVLYRIP